MSSSLRSILAKVSNSLSEITDKALQKLSGPPTNLNNGENLEALDNTAFRVNGKWVAVTASGARRSSSGREPEGPSGEAHRRQGGLDLNDA